MKRSLQSFAVSTTAMMAMALGLSAADPANFRPDGKFTGSALTGWRVLGDAEWTASNGELIGKAKPGTNGGWLLMDKSFQDVQLYMNFRCTGECKSGVLLRGQKTPDGGMKGVYVSLTNGDTNSYAVTLDATGKETAREQLTPPSRGGGAGGAGRAGAPAPAAGAPAAGAPAAPPAQAAPATPPAQAAPPAAGGGRAAGAPAPTPARGTQLGSAARGRPTLKMNDWNETYIGIGTDGPPAGTTAGPIKVVSTYGPAQFVIADESNAAGFGTVALYVGGTGEVRYKDFAWKDLMSVVEPKEQVSPRYTMQQVTSVYYGWGATTGDLNRDGNVDIVSGPFYYAGPDFTDRRRYRNGNIYNPESSFAPDMVNLAHDFTGDGWVDILSTLGNRNMELYVNPKGESRRWDRFPVLPTISSEIVLLKDLDKDGKPEVVFGQGAANGYGVAKPDPVNPTAVWPVTRISAPGQAVNGHGLGVGDVNSDGRLDIVVPTGWYEQPAGGITTAPWTFHEAVLGDSSVFGSGGGEMGVYDVNGDGVNDVVAGSAHNWGLNWFEQKKDGTWTKHMIAGNFATENAGNVVFSESHAQRFVDVTGDKIPDMITGKRYWSEAGTNTMTHMDPFGAPVLYIYRTVRDPKAPGGARFVPELVHNKSGIGSSFDVVDLNKDGRLDIVTATTFGTYVFFGQK